MRSLHRLTVPLYLLVGFGGGLAVAGDGLMITINNDTSDNIYVTAYDQNTSPPQLVLSRTPIYGSASLTVSITPDNSGHGHLSWTAITVDPDMHMCGHKDKPNLNDGDTVNVHADADCGG